MRKNEKRQEKRTECKLERKWSGEGGGKKRKRSSRQKTIERTASWTKGKNNKVLKPLALGALLGYPHLDHCPVIYSFHNIGLLRYSLNINELTLKSHQRNITSSVRSSPTSKEKSRFPLCYCSTGLRSVTRWNFSYCSIVPIVIRIHTSWEKGLSIKNSMQSLGTGGWHHAPFIVRDTKTGQTQTLHQHHHHTVILREVWGKGEGPCEIPNIHEERREEGGGLSELLLKCEDAYRKSRLAFCFPVEHNTLTLTSEMRKEMAW